MSALRLSYAELGARLGRSADAVRVLARRKGWQRVTGNDGRVVVLVDEGELPPDRPPERPGERPPEHSDTDRLRDELEAERRLSGALRERVARPSVTQPGSPICTLPSAISPTGGPLGDAMVAAADWLRPESRR